MRAAAWVALLCAAALLPGCRSHSASSIGHPRILEGTVARPDLHRLERRIPVSVDFVSSRRGFLATSSGRILRTDDGGETWAFAGSTIRHLADIDFVSARQGFATTSGNVLLSTHDGADSWQRVNRFSADSNGFAAAVVFVDSNHGWVLPPSRRLYRTRDSGRTWDSLSLPCGTDDHAVGPSFLDERNGYLVCGGQPSAGNQEKALYVTNDGGETWRVRAGNYVLHPGRRGVLPGTGYAAGLQFDTAQVGLLSAARGGIFRTVTGGLTWTQLFYADGIEDFTWPASQRLFAVFFRIGALRSDDAGRHWSRVFPPGYAEPDGPVAFFSAQDGIAFGAPELLGGSSTVLATEDGGHRWFRRGQVPEIRGVGQVFRFGRVVLATDGTTLVRSNDGGAHWRKVSALPPGRYGWFSFPSEDVGFVADDRDQLLRSDDGGFTWRVVSRRTRQLDRVIFVSASNGFAVDYGRLPPDDGEKHPSPRVQLLHSDDGGKRWSPVDTPLENVLGAYALDDEHWWIFANAHCTLAKACSSGQILRTADGGRHWDLIRLPTTLDVETVSFVSPTAGFVGSPAYGLYRTEDGGVNWSYVYPESR